MNDYMRENKIEPVPPQLARAGQGAPPTAALTQSCARAGALGRAQRSRASLTARRRLLELADDDPLAALALDADRRAPVLLRRRAEAAREPQHQAGAGGQHLLAVAEEVRLDAVLARLGDLSANSSGP